MTSYLLTNLMPVLMVEPDKNGVLPVLMLIDDIIDIKEAMRRSGRCDRTIRDWCRLHGIGRKPSKVGRWQISGPALEALMHGDFEALERLRRGERDSPRVKRYIENHLDNALAPS